MGQQPAAASPASSLADLVRNWQRAADDVLLAHVRPDTPVALLDAPYHDNFGDAAIWLGERAWLQRVGMRRRYCSDVGRYDASELARLHPDGPILLHGGGNFGDYWPEHQQHREQIAADFPDRQIIQLPQSIGFQPGARVQVHDVLLSHARFVVLARDAKSLEVSASLGLPCKLVPDAALNLGQLRRHRAPRYDVLVLARTDHEGTGLGERSVIASQPLVQDWFLSRPRRAAWFATKAPARVVRRLPPASGVRDGLQSRSALWYDAMARLMVSTAVRQLSSARVVVTDRLHAHILATLLGIPNVVVDNNYGKLSGVLEAWTAAAPDVWFAESVDEAFERAEGLRHRQP